MIGTSYQAVQSVLEQGKNVILDIDMQGVIQLQSRVQSGTSPFTNPPLCIFVAPPSIEKLKERLTGRGTETKDSAEARLNAAIKEMQWGKANGSVDVVVVNDELDRAYADLKRAIFE